MSESRAVSPPPSQARQISALIPDEADDVTFEVEAQWVNDTQRLNALGELLMTGRNRRRTIRIITTPWVDVPEPADL